MIRETFRKFAQFYGAECWQNGRQNIRELPNPDEFVDLFAAQLEQKLNIAVVMQAEGADGVKGAAVGNSAAGKGMSVDNGAHSFTEGMGI